MNTSTEKIVNNNWNNENNNNVNYNIIIIIINKNIAKTGIKIHDENYTQEKHTQQ